MGLITANDVPDRDPKTFVISGSNDGGSTFTEIATGNTDLPEERHQRVLITFDNSINYTTYKIVFPTIRNSNSDGLLTPYFFNLPAKNFI